MSVSNTTKTPSGSAIIFGGTGAVGKHLVNELLQSPQYSNVHAFVRKPFKAESAHKDSSKLVEHVIDFDKLMHSDEETVTQVKKVGAEAIYITLGTTRAAAGSADNFVKIDREYVLAAAKAALTDEKATMQRLLYCSSAGANSSSFFLYPKSKGLTEEGLAALGYSDLLIFHPGMLANAQRPNARILEKAVGALTNIAGKVTDSVEIKVDILAKAMITAGVQGTSGLTSLGAGNPPSASFKRAKDGEVTIISNAEALRLVRAK